jgi:hypothetical protein
MVRRVFRAGLSELNANRGTEGLYPFGQAHDAAGGILKMAHYGAAKP